MKTAVLLFVALLMGAPAAGEPLPDPGHVLYLARCGDLDGALDLYEVHHPSPESHDYATLQDLAMTTMETGFHSRDPESVLLSVFGAGIALHERALLILEQAIDAPYPPVQLAAINFLGTLHDDIVNELLNRAMSSRHLLVRLEAAYLLAHRRDPNASGQLESLLAKVPEELRPLFPRLFAADGSAAAVRQLKVLINDRNPRVCLQAITSAAGYHRDDLLPQIRALATHLSPVQQEACAAALGTLGDENSITRLRELADRGTAAVRLAALQALYRLGDDAAGKHVADAARCGEPFAIAALGEVSGTEALLEGLTHSGDLQVATNAAIALLDHRDPRCIPGLMEILIRDSRDLAIVRITTPGGGLAAWKVVPSAKQNFKDNPIALEFSMHMRERFLAQALELPAEDFLRLAEMLLARNQHHLAPTLIHLLQELGNPEAVMLLQRFQQKVGAPLIRHYCNLALFRLKVDGPYADNLRQWVRDESDVDLIKFRPYLPWEMLPHQENYQLTPDEMSRLLIDSVEALAQHQEAEDIAVLLYAMRHGNKKNRYALAGLLMRATM